MMSRIRLQIHVMNNDRYGEEEREPNNSGLIASALRSPSLTDMNRQRTPAQTAAHQPDHF